MWKKVTYKFILFVFAIVLPLKQAVSSHNLDSLKQIALTEKGSKRLSALYDIAYDLSFSDYENAMRYSRNGLEEALALRDSNFVSKFMINIAYIYKDFYGDNQSALEYLRRAETIAKNIKNNEILASCYTGFGLVYIALGIYDKALDYHTKSLVINEIEENDANIAIAYNNIGLVYYKIGDLDKSIDYYRRSIKLKLINGDTSKTDFGFINMGLAFVDKKENREAIKNFQQALRIATKNKSYRRFGTIYNGLGEAYTNLGNYDSAEYYLQKSIEESKRVENEFYASIGYYLLAKLEKLKENYGNAIEYLNTSYVIANHLNDKHIKSYVFRLYAEIYEGKNEFDSAYYYQKLRSEMEDSIFNEKLAKNMANVQIAYVEEKNQKVIENQQATITKNRQFNLFLLSILGLSITLIVVIFRNYKLTNKINMQLQDSKLEIEHQKENLEQKNKQLAEAQVIIHKQNQKLRDINVDLDKKVKGRTAELKKSNYELEKAVKDLDQFIYKTSHDLRGPLATMQGIINLGVMETKNQKSIEYFNTLHKVTSNLNNVLFRLIEVHETYQKKPLLEEIDPVKEIKETTSRVSKFSIISDINIVTELEAKGAWVSDRVLFNLIIENMLRSAMLYKDRGESFIKIKSRFIGNSLKIIFEDNGFGVQPGYEEKVFNIFFKGSPRPGGTGLEIYTAKIAAEKLGGKITLVKPLKNTIFEIDLPLV